MADFVNPFQNQNVSTNSTAASAAVSSPSPASNWLNKYLSPSYLIGKAASGINYALTGGIKAQPWTPPAVGQDAPTPSGVAADAAALRAGQMAPSVANSAYSAPAPNVSLTSSFAPQGYSGIGSSAYSPSMAFAPNTVPVSFSPSANFNASSLSGTPTTYQDLVAKIGQNEQTYQQAFQKTSGEQQAEQDLLSAIKNSQDLQAQVRGGQMNELYGGTVKPLELATGRAAEIGQQNQLGVLNAQNAQSLAEQNLQLQQGSRQIATQGAQFGMQSDLSLAGLLKPSEIQPGSSLVSPTGQVSFQGSGVRAPGPADIQTLAQTILNNGGATDLGTAMQMATQYYQQQQSLGLNGVSPQMPNSPNPLFTQGNVVNGYDLSTYATDPQYAQKITNIAQATSTIPYTASAFGSYISNLYPNSPVTGSMIMSAATKYGVDPGMLTAVLQNESHFGTNGAGAKTNNPGNVGNVDSGATRTYKSVADGVAATAYELANRHVGSQPTGAAMLPGPLEGLRLTAPNGASYINIDKVPTQLQNLAKLSAPQLGVSVLNQGEASAVQNASGVIENLQGMNDTVNKILSPGLFGRIKGLTVNSAAEALQSNTDISAFKKYRDTAINALQSLAGGSGSGLRLTEGEINNAISTMPTIHDNLETAQSKINGIQQLISTRLNALLPNSTPTQSIGGQQQQQQQNQAYVVGNQTYVQGPDGLYYPQ